MDKHEIIKCGDEVVGILEVIREAERNGSLDFIKVHRACKDDIEHPSWDVYETIIRYCRALLDEGSIDWREYVSAIAGAR